MVIYCEMSCGVCAKGRLMRGEQTRKNPPKGAGWWVGVFLFFGVVELFVLFVSCFNTFFYIFNILL